MRVERDRSVAESKTFVVGELAGVLRYLLRAAHGVVGEGACRLQGVIVEPLLNTVHSLPRDGVVLVAGGLRRGEERDSGEI